jgi:hypothetical protein
MASELEGIDVVGPVRAEIFLVCLEHGQVAITGPDGARPWVVQLEDAEHPVATVERIIGGVVGRALLVHSTSWRREGKAVILSFLAVIGPEQVGDMESAPAERTELARSEATEAPVQVAGTQVLEHALRHLAWLAQDDPVVRELLSPGWRAALAGYVPEPFRSFARPPVAGRRR